MSIIQFPNQSRKIVSSVDRFSELRSAEHLVALYQKEFIGFCLQASEDLPCKYPANWSKDDLLLSFRRREDLVILNALYETYLKSDSKNKFEILEIGAGSSAALDCTKLSPPWLARWLSKTFKDLNIAVSDICLGEESVRGWDYNLEESFGLIAFKMDYTDWNATHHVGISFVFGRHLNACPEDEELAGLEENLYLHLAVNGQAVIGFDGMPIMKYHLAKRHSCNINGREYRCLMANGESIIPTIEASEKLFHTGSLPIINYREND